MHCKILSLTPDVNNLHDYSSLLQYPNHQLLPTGDLPVQARAEYCLTNVQPEEAAAYAFQ